MTYSRCAVIKGPDVLGPHSSRPYVVLSDSSHPFVDNECIVASFTRTGRPQAIRIRPSDFTTGGFPNQAPSYVSPWAVLTLKNTVVRRVEGELDPAVVDNIAHEASSYMGI